MASILAVAGCNHLKPPRMIRCKGPWSDQLGTNSPQVSEAELEQIARLGVDGALEASVSEGAGGDATRTLLGQYNQTPAARLGMGPGATPMRTPRAGPGGSDRIMAEAAALARLQVGRASCHGTPLGSSARGS